MPAATTGSYNYVSTSSVVVSSIVGFVTTPINAGSYFLQSIGPINTNVPIDSPVRIS